MSKVKKLIFIAIAAIVFVYVFFQSKLPTFIRHHIGMYTLSEAMETESYGLIYEVVYEADGRSDDLERLCEPKLEHMEIALKNDWRDVMLLFLKSKSNPNPNQMNSKGYTLLDEAILHSSYEMCELLLDDSLESEYTDIPSPINAKVNQENRFENTALDELCKISNKEMLEGEWERRVQLLIEHGAKVSDKTRSLLQKSDHKDKISWIDSILQGKEKKAATDFAKIDMEQLKQKTFTKEISYNLLKSLQVYGSTETIRLVLNDLKIQKYLDESQKEELLEMAAANNANIAEIYLKNGFPVTDKVLGEAIWSKNYNETLVKKLINKNNQDTVVKNWKDNQDYSLFMIAVGSDRVELVNELYKNQVDLNYKNQVGLTAKKISKKYWFDTLDTCIEMENMVW